MKNNQPFPFERNRYYAGKMLNSADFQTEQLYMNNKRRFINNMLFGTGILSGLDVYNLDDLSILIESGAAIDGAGREIVIESSVVKKLSAIEGFEQLMGEWAVLGLRYREEDVQPVYSVARQEEGKEYEFNHISEGYELFLKDLPDSPKLCAEDEFILEEVLLDHEDYRIKVCIPAGVSIGREVKLEVAVEKLSERRQRLSLSAVLQLPVFTTQAGRHELLIELPDVLLEKGEKLRKEYWLHTEYSRESETTVILDETRASVLVEGSEAGICRDFKMRILLYDIAPEELAFRETGRPNLEKRSLHKLQEEVDLAVFKLIRTEGACLIGEIHEKGVKQYIAAPAESRKRSRFLSYFTDRAETEQLGAEKENRAVHGEIFEGREQPAAMASGSLEIPLRMDMGKGEVCYSEEIMHGLGKGNVYVQVGIESLEDNIRLGRSTKSTVYGDSDLFRGDGHMDIRTAVKVFNDKGSFQVAAKLLGEQRSIVLLMNWVAIKFTSIDEGRVNDDISGMSIVPETPTVHIPVKGSFYFGVKFNNMAACRLSYELTESGSGEISSDGIYTAPGKEGVYEIHIYCTDIPKVSTYAYAVVSK